MLVAELAAELEAEREPKPYPVPDGGETWDGPWPEREWIIPGWLPAGRLGMLGGHGGVGKSRLALQLAARIAAPKPSTGPAIPSVGGEQQFARIEPAHCGPVMIASWEDEREEVGRRLFSMTTDELADAGKLTDRLRYVDMRGEGALWGPEAGGYRSGHIATRGVLTDAGRRVRLTAEAIGARLLVVDSLAGAYAGDENVRALVRAFCADWDAWASHAHCAVMLIAHPPKSPSDYSGSTDWHNAARWRWALGRRSTHRNNKPKQVEAPLLRCTKASYGPIPEPVWLVPSKSFHGWQCASEDSAAEATARLQGMKLHGIPDSERV